MSRRKAAPRRMTLAAVERRCASKPDTVLTTPFGPRPHVYKTAGKMFELCGHLDGEEVVSLKCDPERSSTLRLTFPAITEGALEHDQARRHGARFTDPRARRPRARGDSSRRGGAHDA